MATLAPDVRNDEPPPAAQPVLDSKQLRKIAEAVSGMRGTPPYWLVLTQTPDGSVAHEMVFEDPGPRPDAVVIPCQTAKDAERPRVAAATIRAGLAREVDLLHLHLEDEEGDVEHRADAVFWSGSAVEKFVVPYYASVYGDEAGDAVTELLDTFNGVAADAAAPDGAGPNTTEVYALVHIPRSEYIELDDPPAGQGCPSRLHHFAVLAVDRSGSNRVVTVEGYRRQRGGG